MAVKVNPEKLRSTLASLKARFETGSITQMKELTDLYVTGLIAAIGIGYDGFINKCNAPEKFVMEDIVKLAQILDVDINLIMTVIVKQAQKNVSPRNISHLLQSNP